MDSKRADVITLSAPIASELLVCADKTARNYFYKQIFVDIGWLPTATNNHNSLAGVVGFLNARVFLLQEPRLFFIRVTSIPVQRNLRSLVTPEIV